MAIDFLGISAVPDVDVVMICQAHDRADTEKH